MSRSAYGSNRCWVCRRWVSAAGFGWYQHCMKHVREGTMRRVKRYYGKRGTGWDFVRPDPPSPTLANAQSAVLAQNLKAQRESLELAELHLRGEAE